MGTYKWIWTITDTKTDKTVKGVDLRTIALDFGYESCTPFYQHPERFIRVKEPLSEYEQPVKKYKPHKKTGEHLWKHSKYNKWKILRMVKSSDVLCFTNRSFRYYSDNLEIPELERNLKNYLKETVGKQNFIFEMNYNRTDAYKIVKNHLISLELVVKFETKNFEDNMNLMKPILDKIEEKINNVIKG